MAVTVSHKGYIKREPLSSYRIQGRGGKGLIGQRGQEDDFPEHIFVASTHDHILFFTDDGKAYSSRVFELPQLGRMAQGRHIYNILSLSPGQRVVSIVPVPEFAEGCSIFMISRRGFMKKVPLREFSSIRRLGISVMGIEEGDKLLDAQLVKRGQEVIVATRLGMAVRIDEAIVRDMGRSARGLHGPRLKEGDEIVSLVIADSPEDSLLTVCEKGIGKRCKVSDYRKTATQRACGVINIKIVEKNGPVIACIAVNEEDEVMLMSASGKVIRSRVNEMREMGRGAIGVRLMDLDEGDKVVSVAKVAREDSIQAQEKAAAIKKEREETMGAAAETPPAEPHALAEEKNKDQDDSAADDAATGESGSEAPNGGNVTG